MNVLAHKKTERLWPHREATSRKRAQSRGESREPRAENSLEQSREQRVGSRDQNEAVIKSEQKGTSRKGQRAL